MEIYHNYTAAIIIAGAIISGLLLYSRNHLSFFRVEKKKKISD
jgi:hypothetical protein